MLIDVHNIRLLREVVLSNNPPSLGLFIRFLAPTVSKRPLNRGKGTYSSSSGVAPFLKPGFTDSSPSGSSSPLSRFFLRLASPLLSLATSIPCRARLSFLSSMRSAILSVCVFYTRSGGRRNGTYGKPASSSFSDVGSLSSSLSIDI